MRYNKLVKKTQGHSMKQTLILSANTHADAKEIMAIIKDDKEVMAALFPKGDRKLYMTGQKVQVDSMKETLTGILTTARIDGYGITIENELITPEIEDQRIIDNLMVLGITKPLERLKWLAEHTPQMGIGRASKIISAKDRI